MVEYIGIDIGGTNIRVGAIDENENLIFKYKESTFKDVENSEDLYKKIINLIKKVPDYENTKAIGIGVPGSIDMKLGQVITSKNVGILKNFPLIERLTKEINKPVFMENDARVATLAEAIKGKGSNKDIVCYITISTGLGGGIAINKNLYHGSNNLGAYFSRMILDGKNTTDSLISGTALIKKAKEKLDINYASELFDLEKKNNQFAKEIANEFKENLTTFLLNVSSTFNPDIIILGGGVIKSKDDFLQEVIKIFKKKAHPLAINTIINVSELEEPGVLGAALFAKNELK